MNLLPFLFAVARRYWKVALLTVLVLALIVQTFRLDATQARLEAESAARARDWLEYARAQAEAESEALSQKLKKEAEDARNAENAQIAYDRLRERFDGLVRAQAARGAPGRANLSRPAAPAGVPALAAEGFGIPFGSIIVSVDDALICADNAAYALAAHQWALGLSGGEPPHDALDDAKQRRDDRRTDEGGLKGE